MMSSKLCEMFVIATSLS